MRSAAAAAIPIATPWLRAGPWITGSWMQLATPSPMRIPERTRRPKARWTARPSRSRAPKPIPFLRPSPLRIQPQRRRSRRRPDPCCAHGCCAVWSSLRLTRRSASTAPTRRRSNLPCRIPASRSTSRCPASSRTARSSSARPRSRTRSLTARPSPSRRMKQAPTSSRAKRPSSRSPTTPSPASFPASSPPARCSPARPPRSLPT